MSARVRSVGETGSTNADLLAEAAGGAPEGTWLRADRQREGRGRLGRTWVSPPGNLHASTIVRLHPVDPPGHTLSLVAGIALHDAAAAWAGPAGPIVLKWPNDLMAGTSKLAGILIERSGSAAVIGFGMNLADSPGDLGRPCTSIARLGLTAPEPQAVAETLAGSVGDWLGRWRSQPFEAIRQAWLARAHPLGTALTVMLGSGTIEGRFGGLAEDGALILERSGQQPVVVHAGDVGLG